MAVPVYGGDPEVLCHALCVPKRSPDATWLYLRVWSEAPGKTLMLRYNEDSRSRHSQAVTRKPCQRGSSCPAPLPSTAKRRSRETIRQPTSPRKTTNAETRIASDYPGNPLDACSVTMLFDQGTTMTLNFDLEEGGAGHRRFIRTRRDVCACPRCRGGERRPGCKACRSARAACRGDSVARRAVPCAAV